MRHAGSDAPTIGAATNCHERSNREVAELMSAAGMDGAAAAAAASSSAMAAVGRCGQPDEAGSAD